MFGVIINSCAVEQNIATNQSCDQKTAKVISDRLLKKNKYILENYESEIFEDSLTFKVNYKLKNKYSDGGGAEITISKKDCSTIDRVFYQ
jgi:hypothetical protein